MNKDEPLVSVVMPNYNTPEEYLRRAIESVLGQTYKNIEFIIVDDASTGSDVEIIKSYNDNRMVLLQNESNRHISFSLNRGFGAARGEYVARMDSDDICLPRRLEKQVRFMQRRNDIDVLCTRAEFFGDKKGVYATGIRNPEHMKTEVFFGCPIIHPSVMFRASFLREHSALYSTGSDYKAAEDYELWSRCAFTGRIFEYPQVLLKYRMHARQVSTATRKLQDENANNVRRNMLFKLGIKPDPHEMDVHFYFCIEAVSPDIFLSETESWANRLLQANEQYRAFDERCFRKAVMQHFLVTAVKTLHQKRAGLRQVMRYRLMKKAMSPVYYPGYIKRYLFSKRLNRLQMTPMRRG
ncbi:MAG: glycosyltransferase [Bacillota bacterium]